MNIKRLSLLEAVERMRESQKIYARTNAPSDKEAAKRHERDVDAIIKAIREKLARENQPELIEGNG